MHKKCMGLVWLFSAIPCMKLAWTTLLIFQSWLRRSRGQPRPSFKREFIFQSLQNECASFWFLKFYIWNHFGSRRKATQILLSVRPLQKHTIFLSLALPLGRPSFLHAPVGRSVRFSRNGTVCIADGKTLTKTTPSSSSSISSSIITSSSSFSPTPSNSAASPALVFRILLRHLLPRHRPLGRSLHYPLFFFMSYILNETSLEGLTGPRNEQRRALGRLFATGRIIGLHTPTLEPSLRKTQ